MFWRKTVSSLLIGGFMLPSLLQAMTHAPRSFPAVVHLSSFRSQTLMLNVEWCRQPLSGHREAPTPFGIVNRHPLPQIVSDNALPIVFLALGAAYLCLSVTDWVTPQVLMGGGIFSVRFNWKRFQWTRQQEIAPETTLLAVALGITVMEASVLTPLSQLESLQERHEAAILERLVPWLHKGRNKRFALRFILQNAPPKGQNESLLLSDGTDVMADVRRGLVRLLRRAIELDNQPASQERRIFVLQTGQAAAGMLLDLSPLAELLKKVIASSTPLADAFRFKEIFEGSGKSSMFEDPTVDFWRRMVNFMIVKKRHAGRIQVSGSRVNYVHTGTDAMTHIPHDHQLRDQDFLDAIMDNLMAATPEPGAFGTDNTTVDSFIGYDDGIGIAEMFSGTYAFENWERHFLEILQSVGINDLDVQWCLDSLRKLKIDLLTHELFTLALHQRSDESLQDELGVSIDVVDAGDRRHYFMYEKIREALLRQTHSETVIRPTEAMIKNVLKHVEEELVPELFRELREVVQTKTTHTDESNNANHRNSDASRSNHEEGRQLYMQKLVDLLHDQVARVVHIFHQIHLKHTLAAAA